MKTREEALLEHCREIEAEIADFERRMRKIEPLYVAGDRLEFRTGAFVVLRYSREGMPGYWLRPLRPPREDLFVPIDLERELHPAVH